MNIRMVATALVLVLAGCATAQQPSTPDRPAPTAPASTPASDVSSAAEIFGSEPFIDLIVAAIVYDSSDLLALTKQCSLSVDRLAAAMNVEDQTSGEWGLEWVSVAGTPVPGFEMLTPQPHVLQLKFHRQTAPATSTVSQLDIWMPSWESLRDARSGRVGIERVDQGLTLLDPFPQRNFVVFLGTASTVEGKVVERFAPAPSAELSAAFMELFDALARCGLPFVHTAS